MEKVNEKYVAYYRVSTQKQGVSGLGLEAQREMIQRYISNGEIVREFTDIETGKTTNKRQVLEAIVFAKENNFIFITAKLDRLSRNSAFINKILEDKVRYVFCDTPNADVFTLQILGSVAEKEAKMISERTKAALGALKARGVKLGSPKNLNDDARKKSVEVKKKNALNNNNNRLASHAACLLRKSGMTLFEILLELNKHGHKTSSGNEFKSTTQVLRLVKNVIPKPKSGNL